MKPEKPEKPEKPKNLSPYASSWFDIRVSGGIATGLIVIARLAGLFQPLEWATLDMSLRWRPAEPPDDRIVIVGINETDIQTVGDYPIPDNIIAQLLRQLQSYEVRAIGLDLVRDLPVEPGYEELVSVFQSTDTIIGGESVVPDSTGGVINPPPALPPEQVGFFDALPDLDGNQRRSLLGAATRDGGYQFSMAMRLASLYLASEGYKLKNGHRNPSAMSFGSVELPPIYKNIGGYVGVDASGDQTLINFRSGSRPFPVVSLYSVLDGTVDPEVLRDRVVFIGLRSNSVRSTLDISQSAAVASSNPGLIFGVDIQAHITSQIISAVLDGRSLLHTWLEGWEYIWIIVWGGIGLAISQQGFKLGQHFRVILVTSIILLGSGYLSILVGWWIPVLPALAAFWVNGVVLHGFYLYDRETQARISDRQQVIEQTFTALHNGPLQSIAKLIRELDNPDFTQADLPQDLSQINDALRFHLYNDYDDSGPLSDLSTLIHESEFQQDIKQPFTEVMHNGPLPNLSMLIRESSTTDFTQRLQQDLCQLNQDVRAIYVTMQKETIQDNWLHLQGQNSLDLNSPLHELLCEVYDFTLERDFPCFANLAVKVRTFEPFDETGLSAKQKRGLCRFLEEALCNVGKYAVGARRLIIECRHDGTANLIRVIDNGQGIKAESNPVPPSQNKKQPEASSHGNRVLRGSKEQSGKHRGSQQAIQLARQLNGTFARSPHSPKGTRCELIWQPYTSPWHRLKRQIQDQIQQRVQR